MLCYSMNELGPRLHSFKLTADHQPWFFEASIWTQKCDFVKVRQGCCRSQQLPLPTDRRLSGKDQV